MSFNIVTEFEYEVAKFFGAPYAIAVDSCTHGIELALRYTDTKTITVPKHTYISVPFLAQKLNIELCWKDEDWMDYYYLAPGIIDAAVLWKPKSYIPHTFMAVSFQFQKHLSLGRGGILLVDNSHAADKIKKMSYDGRSQNKPWMEQNIDTIGYHYYMTPETAKLGLEKLEKVKNEIPKQWNYADYPDLTQMSVFK